MRIKPRQHTFDCRLNQLCIVRLLDIVRAHALEYVTEKAELLERLSGCLCARCLDHCPGLRSHQRHGSACNCAKEDQENLAQHGPSPRESVSLSVPLLSPRAVAINGREGPTRPLYLTASVCLDLDPSY